jgi:hypothetical protein
MYSLLKIPIAFLKKKNRKTHSKIHMESQKNHSIVENAKFGELTLPISNIIAKLK